MADAADKVFRSTVEVLAQVREALACSATGSPDRVRTQLGTLIDTFQPDELMITGMIHDHAARLRSFEIAAEILQEMRLQPEAA